MTTAACQDPGRGVPRPLPARPRRQQPGPRREGPGARLQQAAEHLRDYLDAMDAAPFNAVGPEEARPRVLAALGPKMLELSRDRADGAHPVPDDTRAHAHVAGVLGPDVRWRPSRWWCWSPTRRWPGPSGPGAISFYLRAPGYLANLRRLGFTDDDWADRKAPSDRLVDASSRGVGSTPSRRGSASTTSPAPTTWRCKCSAATGRSRSPSGASWRPPCADRGGRLDAIATGRQRWSRSPRTLAARPSSPHRVPSVRRRRPPRSSAAARNAACGRRPRR